MHYRFQNDIKRIASKDDTCLADVPYYYLETLINKLDMYGNSCLVSGTTIHPSCIIA